MKQPFARVLMLVENSYPADTRVRNEAWLLQSSGYEVTVISLRTEDEPAYQVIGGVRVYRLPRIELFQKTMARRPGIRGRWWLKLKAIAGYTAEYVYFTTACFVLASYILARYGFDVIHAHNPPDTLFLVALPFKLFGKKFVFDHHDLCPELYQSRYRTGKCLETKLLGIAEWCTLRLADVTIATNESYKQVQIERGRRDARSIYVVRNGPSSARMNNQALPSARLRNLNKCILVYIGSLNPQDGVDYLLRSLYYLRRDLKRGDFHCVIMGTGDSLEDLRVLMNKLQLQENVELPGFVSDEDLEANLAAADVCVDPDPSSPLNDLSTWIKIMEYMAYAKPIVSFALAETRYSAQDSALYVKPNDEAEFARGIATLMSDPELRLKMGASGRKRVEQHLQWSVVGRNLLDAYAHLLGISVEAPTPQHETAELGKSRNWGPSDT
jgi:glycosyltransferase involved in cell wall biosynthesis